MDENIKEILNIIGINFDNLIELDGMTIERDIFLDETKYTNRKGVF